MPLSTVGIGMINRMELFPGCPSVQQALAMRVAGVRILRAHLATKRAGKFNAVSWAFRNFENTGEYGGILLASHFGLGDAVVLQGARPVMERSATRCKFLRPAPGKNCQQRKQIEVLLLPCLPNALHFKGSTGHGSHSTGRFHSDRDRLWIRWKARRAWQPRRRLTLA